MPLPLSALLPPGPAANAPLETLPAAPASVAILGQLPASAPMHLALSSVASSEKHENEDDAPIALVLTRSGSEWVSALLSDGKGKDGDAWFMDEARKAGVQRMAHRVVAKYLPTLAHLSLFLSLLHYDPLATAAHPARLEKRPSVIILHDLSSYLVDVTEVPADADDEALGAPLVPELKWTPKPSTTISSFCLPLSLAITAITNLNASLTARGLPPTQLILLDSFATQMMLPIVPPRSDGKAGPDADVKTMVERVCDWVAVVKTDDEEEDSGGGDDPYAVQLDYHIHLPRSANGVGPPRKVSFKEDVAKMDGRWRADDQLARGAWRWLG